MCINLYLKKVFRVLKDSLGREYGWKVFRLIQNRKYGGDFCGYRTVRPVNVWLKSEDFSPTPVEMPNAMRIYDYEVGWHVFVRREDAKLWKSNSVQSEVVKVLVQGVREKGFTTTVGSCELECFIADEIFIPK